MRSLFARLFRARRRALAPAAVAAPAEAISLFAPHPAAARAATPPAQALFATLRTGRENVLVAGEGRVGMAASPAPGQALIAVIPDANRALCFLMAQDLRLISVQSDGMESVAVSAYRLQSENAALIRLRHPHSPQRYLGVTPAGHGAPDGCVIFDSLGRNRLDLFEPLAIDASELPRPFLRAAAEICAAVARPYRAGGLMGRLRDLSVRPGLAEALIRVLPREELAELAADLLEREEARGLLAEVMPQNRWARDVLPALAAWRRERGAAGPDNTLASPAGDEFAGDPLEGFGQPQAGFALTALARARVRPRRGACLLAAARNEGPYLLEWLGYHRALGFEHAFIYTNDNWDGSDAVLAALARAGAITLVHNEAGSHCGPQYKAYSHALSLLPQILDYAWAAVIDLDEFIGFDANVFGGIEDFLAWQQTQPVDAVALCWQVFAGGRGDAWRDAPTLERFTRREPHANQHVKSIFRPHLFWHSHAHYPQASFGAPFVYRTESGALHHHAGEGKRLAAFAEAPSARTAWVNHYLLRSAPEALWKMARGHGDWKGQVAERHLEMARFVCRSYVNLADKADLVEDRRILSCAPGRGEAVAALRALPGVAEADDSVRARFAERLGRMVRAFVDTPPAEGEPPEFAPFRALLKAQA
jgi:hypothetical protein